MRRLTSGPGPWVQVGDVWADGAGKTSPYLRWNVQYTMRFMRVGSTLYAKVSDTFGVIAAGHTGTAGHTPSFAVETYTCSFTLSTDTVTGAAGALSGHNWNTLYDSGIEFDATYDYQLQSFKWQKGPVVFANIQIFKPGY